MSKIIAHPEPTPSEAQLWRARRDEGLTQYEDAQFKSWLQADLSHREAYLEAEIAWARLALAEYKRPDQGNTLEEAEIAASARIHWLDRLKPAFQAAGPRALAASLAAALVAGGMMLTGLTSFWTSPPEPQTFAFASSDTATKLVTLLDESRVTLKPASRLDAVFSDTERRLSLAEGAATFRVEKDASRPFIVHTQAATIVVTGTWFDTQLRDSGLEVRVREGSVDVKPGSFDEGSASQIEVVSLSAGEAVFTRDGIDFTYLAIPVDREARSNSVVARSKPTSALPAQPEQLVYRAAPLSQVIADINRFSTSEVVLDPSASGLTLSGRFKSDEVDSIMATIDAALPVQIIEQNGARLIVLEEAGD